MKLVTFAASCGAPALGGVIGEDVVALRPALAEAQRAAGETVNTALIPDGMIALLTSEPGLVAAGRALAFAARRESAVLRSPLASVQLRAPLLPPRGGLPLAKRPQS